jgi:hypothetical protein
MSISMSSAMFKPKSGSSAWTFASRRLGLDDDNADLLGLDEMGFSSGAPAV